MALKLKPARGYPSANAVMAMRCHINMATPNGSLGQSALTPAKPYHVGTIPAGSFVLPGIRHTIVAFNGTTPTLQVGTEVDPDGFITTGDAAAGTLGVTDGLVGALSGYVADETPVYVLLSGTGSTAGEWDFVLPFYIQRD